MRIRPFFGTTVALLLLNATMSAAPGDFEHFWVPGCLLVNFSLEAGDLRVYDGGSQPITTGIPSIDTLLAKYSVRSLRRVVDDQTLERLKIIPDLYRLVCLTCPPETDILRMRDDFSRNPHVVYAEPDYLRPVLDRVPNDPLWPQQFDKRLMRCPRAWEFSAASDSIVIVVVDQGVCWQYPDFFDNLWVNPGEDTDNDGVAYTDTGIPGDPDDINAFDDDADGKVDDLIGWDFFRGIPQIDCAPGEDCDSSEDNDPYSVGNHGTEVTGVLGAVGNNGIGATGVPWSTRLLSVRAGCVTSGGLGLIRVDNAISAMLWAVGHGARIVNMSYGSSPSSSAESTAVAACWANGAILCGAAGNAPTPVFPASYPNVISVGSVDNADQVSEFSYSGALLDCFAPGEDIVTASCESGTQISSGTSWSCANASGVFTLLWSLLPQMTNQALTSMVLSHCQNIDSMNPEYSPDDLGYGRIDAAAPIAGVFPYLTLESFALAGDNDGDHCLEPGESAQLTITFHNEQGWQTGRDVHVILSSTDPGLIFGDTTIEIDSISPGLSASNSDSPLLITVSPDITQPRRARIVAEISGAGGFHIQRSLDLPIGHPPILLVADDGNDNLHPFYESALNDSAGGYRYAIHHTAVEGEPTWGEIHEYPILVWVCGNQQANTLTEANQTLLAQYLNAGGKLLLAGQYIDPDIAQTSFYRDFLHATSDGVGTTYLSGVASDPISDATTLLLQGGGCAGNGSLHPSKIVPTDGALPIYTYSDGGAGAIRYADSEYRVVYYAFALEAACGQENSTRYDAVIRNTVAWLEALPTGVDEHPLSTVSHDFELYPNFPNPFNSVTEIRYDLRVKTTVELRVFNTMGQWIVTLIEGVRPSGAYRVQWDGKSAQGVSVSTGIYFYQLKAGDFTSTRKMMLLR